MKPIGILSLLIFTVCFAMHAQTTQQLIDSARFYKNKNYPRVITLAGAAYKQANFEKRFTMAGESAYLSGVGNYLEGNINEALRWYFEAEQIYINLKDTSGLTELYADMCVMYIKIKKFPAADSISKKAIDFSIAIKDTKQLAAVVNNRGLMFLDEGKIDSAIYYFQSSYDFYNKLNDKTGMAYCLDYLSSALSEKGFYTRALLTLIEARKMRIGLGDKTGEIITTNNIGELYLKQKKPYKAAPFFLEAINNAHELNYLEMEMYANNMLAQTYQQQGKYREAYKAQSKFIALNQMLLDEKRIKAIEELQARYETNKKVQQIKLLNNQNKIQQLQISKRNITIFIFLLMFVFSILISWQVYSRYKIKQESKLKTAVIHQQDLAAKGIIEAEERERKRISGDLHDGVGQLFTAVKMNMEVLIERFLVRQPDAGILAEKTMALVDESCDEVRSIAHQIMPNALIKGGLVSALRDFINKIPSDKLKISIETKGINERLENSVETILYRVIQESVNNVIKHADATLLDILLLCNAQEITVTIEDNGKGFNMNDKNKFAGIGLKNMASRIEYLKGTFDISSAPGKGTLVAVHIPQV